MAASDLSGKNSDREPALPDRDELFRVLTENTSELICLFDVAGRLIYVNRSVEHLLGRVPTDFSDFPHPEDGQASLRWFQRTLAGGRDPLYWRVRAASGEWRWMETQGSVVSYRRSPHVLTVCRDVTDRKAAEDALRRNERLLAEAERVAHVGFWENDLEADRVIWSAETYRILGLPPGEGPRTLAEFRDLIHPDDRQLQAEVAGRAERREAPYDVEYRILRPDGEVRYVHSVGEFVRETGRPRRAFGVVRDVTERKRAEQALLNSRQQLRRVIDTLPVGVVVLDRAGDVILANPAFEHIWGEVITSGRERRARSKGYWHDSGKGVEPDQWASARALSQGETCLNELLAPARSTFPIRRRA